MKTDKRKAEKLMDPAGLPAQVLPGVARLTVIGTSRAVVENHTGLASLTGELVEVEAGRDRIRLRGEGLEMLSMDAAEIVVEGRILSVDIE